MFETAEVGRKVSKASFEAEQRPLHTALLEAQREVRAHDIPVVLLISGVEGAGKGRVVDRFNTWLDTRGVETHAFWEETDEMRERPRFWRFWRSLPPRGVVGIMFGSWYTAPIIDCAYDRISAADLERQLARIAQFERMLTADGALIVKLWFHLSKGEQARRLKRDAKEGRTSSPLLKEFAEHYDDFLRASEIAIRGTDTGICRWHIIEAGDHRYRDLTAGTTLLGAIQQRLAAPPPPPSPVDVSEVSVDGVEASVTILDRVAFEPPIDDKAYRRKLKQRQHRLHELAWKARAGRRNVVAVFEGWDAAGKGGAIRRVTAAIDARLYRVISVAAPTDEEKAHHYLWRFWRHVPRSGYIRIYDRSWYGRVLVERVEGFAAADEWMRAYEEINEFEAELVEHGVVLLKFWLHISAEEQLRRFEEREQTPWKQHKITAEDWRNREKWAAYEAAVNDMVQRTSTASAPWTLVPANDKRAARLTVLHTFCERLEQALG